MQILGMIWSSVNEMCVAEQEQVQYLQTTEYGEREKGFFGLRAISMPLDEPTSSPSPEKAVISKTIGHTRKDIELLFLMPFNKI